MKYQVEEHDYDGTTHYVLIAPARRFSMFGVDVPDELVKEYKTLQEKLRQHLAGHTSIRRS